MKVKSLAVLAIVLLAASSCKKSDIRPIGGIPVMDMQQQTKSFIEHDKFRTELPQNK